MSSYEPTPVEFALAAGLEREVLLSDAICQHMIRAMAWPEAQVQRILEDPGYAWGYVRYGKQRLVCIAVTDPATHTVLGVYVSNAFRRRGFARGLLARMTATWPTVQGNWKHSPAGLQFALQMGWCRSTPPPAKKRSQPSAPSAPSANILYVTLPEALRDLPMEVKVRYQAHQATPSVRLVMEAAAPSAPKRLPERHDPPTPRSASPTAPPPLLPPSAVPASTPPVGPVIESPKDRQVAAPTEPIPSRPDRKRRRPAQTEEERSLVRWLAEAFADEKEPSAATETPPKVPPVRQMEHAADSDFDRTLRAERWASLQRLQPGSAS